MSAESYVVSEALSRRVRRHCLRMVHRGGSGHIGSMLSMADILSVLYTYVAQVSNESPRAPERDRVILSKGHGGAALYAVLAEKGFFPLSWLETYYLNDGFLGGHISHYVPGVEFSTGSLGHGMPVACGMAMDAFNAGKKHRVFCIVSDGDCNAGSTWEAIMLAGQRHWDNLVMVVDYNRLQALGASKDIIDLTSLASKLELFGWGVREADGHDHAAIHAALDKTPAVPGRPTAVIFNTVKGKGVSFMENNYKWHYGGLTDQLLEKALRELEETP